MKPTSRGGLAVALALCGAACSNPPAVTDPVEQLAPSEQGPSGSTLSTGGFTYRVSTSRADAPNATDALLRPTITTTATLRNNRSDTAVVQFGACSVSLTAYRTAERQGEPVWRSGASEPWEGTYGRACILVLYERKVAPGAEIPVGSYSSRVIEILGDSLPNGRYYLSATVDVSVAPSGRAVLPAGEFDLTLTRPPLPDSVIHQFITYTAATTVSTGTASTVGAKVTATLTHAGGALVEFPKECVIQLAAYQSRNRRDEAPRSGAPDWRESRPCADGWQQTTLSRGQSITFQTSAGARDILGSSLPTGTYYFAVVVHTRTRNVWLSAGSGELRR